MSTNGIVNAMTVDVEEHFQVSAFERVVDRQDWEAFPSRVEGNTDRLLALLDEASTKATFFVLGWIGERHGKLVRRIAEQGHEVACHGYDHRLVHEQEPQQFERDTRRARGVLQEASGQEVLGYRAASFSIGRGNLWALDVLAEAGFEYDSSLFPVRHDRYGVPGGMKQIHRLKTPRGHSLLEVPPSTIRIGRMTLPVAGGGYLRLYPLALTRWAVRRLNEQGKMPAVVYVHPWELDPEQPRIRASFKSRLRHYVGLRSTTRKLGDLLSTYEFGPVRGVLSRRTDWPEAPRA